jgi:alpha-glucosidase (family GH31 glycosyl hydrolase)
MIPPHFQLSFAPLPEPGAVVLAPGVRFTVITARLIRMEHSADEQFEDRPSQAFWFRRQPVPAFAARCDGQALVPGASGQRSAAGGRDLEIETEHLLLRYRISDAGFTPSGLTVEVKATGATWHFGDNPRRGGNLMGTYRTLDRAAGEVPLEPGLMGRAGWAVVDDSATLVFDEHSWLAARTHPANADLYFFGYGHDYLGCLRDFSAVAGPVPMIPRYILGNWWSRYWIYSAAELLGLMREFKAHDVPLGVCIVDMDWHITQTGNRSTGWTGYTWNRALFPDPPAFIGELHALGLRTALNLHPAEGVHPHEAQYADLARLMGVDPASQEPIPFDCVDPRFVEGYFELLHHPMEAQGVDFWWLDWQQGKQTRLPGLDPLWWLNHLHFLDLGRDGRKRPFVFSRWGGLGNHRYPIGFSGDTIVGWEALAHQPAFTSTAANVGYGWWSHDIGGHMWGIEDDELYARWVQYGVFSPILRMHSTQNPYHERRPWGRGPAAERAATSALRLRHAFIPYIYSMAWRHHVLSAPLIVPMYYSHPETAAAYECGQQYWFGSELIAAPFTAPAHAETGLARQTVWLPDGVWYDFSTGERLAGEGWRAVYGNLDDVPVFARAGAIVPLAPEVGWGGIENPLTLRLLVFPGADNRFDLYEDDGETTDYTRGHYAIMAFAQEWCDDELRFSIAPAAGHLAVIPSERIYRISVRGVARPARVELAVNGVAAPASFAYDEATETVELAPVTLAPTDGLALTLASAGGSLAATRDRTAEKLRKFVRGFRVDTRLKERIDREWPQIASGKASLRSYSGLTDAQVAVIESLSQR